MPDRFPSQIAGDPERSIAPSAPPTDEVAAETAGPTVNPWDRLPRESARSSAGFRAFLELGSGRSCRQVARNLSRERSQILDWSRKHDWAKRSRAWDNHNREENYVERANVSADIKHSRYCRFCLHKVAGRPGGRHTTTTAQAGPNSVRLKIAR